MKRKGTLLKSIFFLALVVIFIASLVFVGLLITAYFNHPEAMAEGSTPTGNYRAGDFEYPWTIYVVCGALAVTLIIIVIMCLVGRKYAKKEQVKVELQPRNQLTATYINGLLEENCRLIEVTEEGRLVGKPGFVVLLKKDLPTSEGEGSILVKKMVDGFHFDLKDSKGILVYRSDSYSTADETQDAISRFLRDVQDCRFSCYANKFNHYRFSLTNGDNNYIGEQYNTAEDCKNVAEIMKQIVSNNCKVIPYTETIA